MTEFNCKAEQQKIIDLVRKWDLKQPILAKEAGMNVSAFKNKLNGNNTGYRFSEVELLKIGTVLDRLGADIQTILESLDKSSDDLL
jgi:hypothetical protein